MFQNFTLLQQTNRNHILSSHDPGHAYEEKYSVHDAMTSYACTHYLLCQGLRKYPIKAKIAAMVEMKQLHDVNVFKPVKKDDLTSQELSQVLSSLMFIKHKQCGRFKARACTDGRPQRLLYNKMDASLPTVKTESVILPSMIDADESRFVGVYDIPDAFLHSKLDEVVHMRVTGYLAKYLEAIAPDVYSSYITIENDKEVIYLLLTRAPYGCLKSALQFWKHLSNHLQDHGCILNPYDSCVANRIIEGLQSTIIWHVDDLKLSHVDVDVVRDEVKWLEFI
jgi:hypothetical protein